MRQHYPNNILRVNTPVIELLRKNPPPQNLLNAVTTSIIEASVQTSLVRAGIEAGKLLCAVRENILALGRVTFPVHYNVNSDYPSCIVVLAHGNTSARLYCRVDTFADEVHVSHMREDTAKPPLIISLSHLRAERYNTAWLN